MIEGLDVSSHNAVQGVPWSTVQFGFVRVSHGLGLDSAALGHLGRAWAAGLACLGAYHYLRGDRPGTAQAEVFWERVCILGAGGVPLALAVDLESLPPPAAPWSMGEYTVIANAFLGRLKELSGRPCAVYGSPGYLAELGISAEHRGPLWAAHWNVKEPMAVPGWPRWAVHQYAVVDGLDRNRFAGSEEDFGRVFGLGRGSAPPPVLGMTVDAVRRAEGRGPGGAESFESYDEGPMING